MTPAGLTRLSRLALVLPIALALACGASAAVAEPPGETVASAGARETANAAAAAVIMTATNTPVGAAEAPRIPAESLATGDARMVATVGGQEASIRNGAELFLGEGVAVELFIDPYPPSTLRAWLDLYVTKDGRPVEDASARIDYDMLAMAHGPWSASAEDMGGGHYLFTLDYIMYGAWDQTVTIRIEGQRYELPLVLVAYP